MDTKTSTRPLLVGEANPYGADPYYALYPLPERASGHRLCTLIMGLGHGEYLRSFERVNLCPQRWSAPVARARATEIMNGDHEKVVLLGKKVAEAFGFKDRAPFTVDSETKFASSSGEWRARIYVLLPHPSGLCRAWNAPGAFLRARTALQDAGVLATPKAATGA
jgi:hypothetical protein